MLLSDRGSHFVKLKLVPASTSTCIACTPVAAEIKNVSVKDVRSPWGYGVT